MLGTGARGLNLLCPTCLGSSVPFLVGTSCYTQGGFSTEMCSLYHVAPNCILHRYTALYAMCIRVCGHTEWDGTMWLCLMGCKHVSRVILIASASPFALELVSPLPFGPARRGFCEYSGQTRDSLWLELLSTHISSPLLPSLCTLPHLDTFFKDWTI